MWNIKIVQIDNRNSNIYKQSKDLIAGRDHMNTYSNSWHDVDRVSMKQEELSNPWKFWDFSRAINAVQTKRMNLKKNPLISSIEYKWINEHTNDDNRHCTWVKIKGLIKLLTEEVNRNTIIIFIDSDAIIRDRCRLLNLVEKFIDNGEKEFYISIDVPRARNIKDNIRINTGFMMMKCTPLVLQLFKNSWDSVTHQFPYARYNYPHEQIPIQEFIENNEDYKKITEYSSRTTEVNTPIGEIVRHVWYKEMIPELMIDQAFCLLAEEID